MKKIRKGDEVIVITGRDKGKRGVVQSILLGGQKLIVDGINIAKKHTKQNPNTGEKGGIVLKSHPIEASNVMLYDATSGKGSRVVIRQNKDGLNQRYYKSTNQLVDSQ